MESSSNRFLLASAACFVGGLAAQSVEVAAQLGGADPIRLIDSTHLLVVGGGGFLLAAMLIRAAPGLAPDPAGWKGAAPRAFWLLVLGVILRAGLAPWGKGDAWFVGFVAPATLAGQFLEIVAIGMLAVGAMRAPE